MRRAPSSTCSSSEQRIEPPRVGRDKPQIGARLRRPLFRRACVLFEQVRDGKPRPQRRAMTPIEGEQLGRRRVRQCARQAVAQIAPNRRAAQSFAFQREEGEFVERIIGAQIIVEFEAIDDARLLAEPDMLRPQIAALVRSLPQAKA